MSWRGIRHNNVGEDLNSEEFHSEELHELAHGTTFPTDASESDLFFNDNDGRLYIYVPD